MRFVSLLLLVVTGCSESTMPPAPTADYGAACSAADPCEGGLSCAPDPPFPGGYCTSVCDGATCGDGARCETTYGMELCLAGCARDADCRSEYQCWRGVCRPPCASADQCLTPGAMCVSGRCEGAECTMDIDCGPGSRCNGGRCEAPMMDAGVPTDCLRGSECPDGICLPASHGGRCSRPCADRDDCGSEAELCSPVPIDENLDGTADTAVAACVAVDLAGAFLAASCTTGAECESRSCHNGQCVEACDDAPDCLLGHRCVPVGNLFGISGTSVPVCWYAARGATIQTDDTDLGTFEVVAGSGASRINYAVADDAVSVSMIIRHVGGDPSVALTFVNVWDPSALRIFDLTEISDLIDQPDRWLPIDSEEAAAMLVPNSTADRFAFRHGRYGVETGALSSGAGDTRRAIVSLTARVKRVEGTPPFFNGTLDLNVFLVGIGVTAAEASSHTRLQSALRELDTVILPSSNIHLGAINFIEITGGDASTYSVIDSSDGPSSEMSRMFRLSAGRTENAINVFLVRGIAAGAGESGGIALGIAGGIPGPPGVHGTSHSGVVVSFDRMVVGDDPRVIAQIMAHEIGHYLGLFHNRERARPCAPGERPTEADPCAPFDGQDCIADTAGGDDTNLMYFALGGSTGRIYNIGLTAGQGFVFVRNPVVR